MATNNVNELFAIKIDAKCDEKLKQSERGNGVYYARSLRSAIRLAKTAASCMTKALAAEELSTNMTIRIGRPDFSIFDRWSENQYWRNRKSCVCRHIKFTLEDGEIKAVEPMIPMSPKMLRVLNKIVNTFKA